MCEQTPIHYKHGDVVWVNLGKSAWWPAEVVAPEELPEDIKETFRKPGRKAPLVVVTFFQETSYEYIKNLNQIYSYNSSRKDEFIKKGMERHRKNTPFMEKFPADVRTAEEKTGGDLDILNNPRYLPEKVTKIDYDSIFGSAKKKESPIKRRGRKSLKNKSPHNRTPGTLMGAASITHRRFLGDDEDYKVRVLVQPGILTPSSDNVYNCDSCSFSTTRIDVMALHNKSHVLGTYTPIAAWKKGKQSPIRRSVKKPGRMTFSKTSTIAEDLALIAQGLPLTTTSDEDEDFDEEDEDKPVKKSRAKRRKKTEKPKVKQLAAEVSAEVKKKDIHVDLLAEWDDEEEEDVTLNTTADGSLDVSIVEPSPVKNLDKSCFDFKEDDDPEIISATPGRKIPRLIPSKRKSAEDTNLATPENNTDRTEQDNSSENVAPVAPIDDDAFKDILEATATPVIPELPQKLKCEQNFPNTKAIKFPDKDELDKPEILEGAKFDASEFAKFETLTSFEIAKPETPKRNKPKTSTLLKPETCTVLEPEIPKTDGLEITKLDVVQPPISETEKPATSKIEKPETCEIEKPEISEANKLETPTKLINIKKRFVKSFEDFEQSLKKEKAKQKSEKNLTEKQIIDTVIGLDQIPEKSVDLVVDVVTPTDDEILKLDSKESTTEKPPVIEDKAPEERTSIEMGIEDKKAIEAPQLDDSKISGDSPLSKYKAFKIKRTSRLLSANKCVDFDNLEPKKSDVRKAKLKEILKPVDTTQKSVVDETPEASSKGVPKQEIVNFDDKTSRTKSETDVETPKTRSKDIAKTEEDTPKTRSKDVAKVIDDGSYEMSSNEVFIVDDLIVHKHSPKSKEILKSEDESTSKSRTKDTFKSEDEHTPKRRSKDIPKSENVDAHTPKTRSKDILITDDIGESTPKTRSKEVFKSGHESVPKTKSKDLFHFEETVTEQESEKKEMPLEITDIEQKIKKKSKDLGKTPAQEQQDVGKSRMKKRFKYEETVVQEEQPQVEKQKVHSKSKDVQEHEEELQGERSKVKKRSKFEETVEKEDQSSRTVKTRSKNVFQHEETVLQEDQSLEAKIEGEENRKPKTRSKDVSKLETEEDQKLKTKKPEETIVHEAQRTRRSKYFEVEDDQKPKTSADPKTRSRDVPKVEEAAEKEGRMPKTRSKDVHKSEDTESKIRSKEVAEAGEEYIPKSKSRVESKGKSGKFEDKKSEQEFALKKPEDKVEEETTPRTRSRGSHLDDKKLGDEQASKKPEDKILQEEWLPKTRSRGSHLENKKPEDELASKKSEDAPKTRSKGEVLEEKKIEELVPKTTSKDSVLKVELHRMDIEQESKRWSREAVFEDKRTPKTRKDLFEADKVAEKQAARQTRSKDMFEVGKIEEKQIPKQTRSKDIFEGTVEEKVPRQTRSKDIFEVEKSEGKQTPKETRSKDLFAVEKIGDKHTPKQTRSKDMFEIEKVAEKQTPKQTRSKDIFDVGKIEDKQTPKQTRSKDVLDVDKIEENLSPKQTRSKDLFRVERVEEVQTPRQTRSKDLFDVEKIEEKLTPRQTRSKDFFEVEKIEEKQTARQTRSKDLFDVEKIEEKQTSKTTSKTVEVLLKPEIENIDDRKSKRKSRDVQYDFQEVDPQKPSKSKDKFEEKTEKEEFPTKSGDIFEFETEEKPRSKRKSKDDQSKSSKSKDVFKFEDKLEESAPQTRSKGFLKKEEQKATIRSKEVPKHEETKIEEQKPKMKSKTEEIFEEVKPKLRSKDLKCEETNTEEKMKCKTRVKDLLRHEESKSKKTDELEETKGEKEEKPKTKSKDITADIEHKDIQFDDHTIDVTKSKKLEDVNSSGTKSKEVSLNEDKRVEDHTPKSRYKSLQKLEYAKAEENRIPETDKVDDPTIKRSPKIKNLFDIEEVTLKTRRKDLHKVEQVQSSSTGAKSVPKLEGAKPKVESATKSEDFFTPDTTETKKQVDAGEEHKSRLKGRAASKIEDHADDQTIHEEKKAESSEKFMSKSEVEEKSKNLQSEEKGQSNAKLEVEKLVEEFSGVDQKSQFPNLPHGQPKSSEVSHKSKSLDFLKENKPDVNLVQPDFLAENQGDLHSVQSENKNTDRKSKTTELFGFEENLDQDENSAVKEVFKFDKKTPDEAKPHEDRKSRVRGFSGRKTNEDEPKSQSLLKDFAASKKSEKSRMYEESTQDFDANKKNEVSARKKQKTYEEAHHEEGAQKKQKSHEEPHQSHSRIRGFPSRRVDQDYTYQSRLMDFVSQQTDEAERKQQTRLKLLEESRPARGYVGKTTEKPGEEHTSLVDDLVRKIHEDGSKVEGKTVIEECRAHETAVIFEDKTKREHRIYGTSKILQKVVEDSKVKIVETEVVDENETKMKTTEIKSSEDHEFKTKVAETVTSEAERRSECKVDEAISKPDEIVPKARSLIKDFATKKTDDDEHYVPKLISKGERKADPFYAPKLLSKKEDVPKFISKGTMKDFVSRKTYEEELEIMRTNEERRGAIKKLEDESRPRSKVTDFASREDFEDKKTDEDVDKFGSKTDDDKFTKKTYLAVDERGTKSDDHKKKTSEEHERNIRFAKVDEDEHKYRGKLKDFGKRSYEEEPPRKISRKAEEEYVPRGLEGKEEYSPRGFDRNKPEEERGKDKDEGRKLVLDPRTKPKIIPRRRWDVEEPVPRSATTTDVFRMDEEGSRTKSPEKLKFASPEKSRTKYGAHKLTLDKPKSYADKSYRLKMDHSPDKSKRDHSPDKSKSPWKSSRYPDYHNKKSKSYRRDYLRDDRRRSDEPETATGRDRASSDWYDKIKHEEPTKESTLEVSKLKSQLMNKLRTPDEHRPDESKSQKTEDKLKRCRKSSSSKVPPTRLSLQSQEIIIEKSVDKVEVTINENENKVITEKLEVIEPVFDEQTSVCQQELLPPVVSYPYIPGPDIETSALATLATVSELSSFDMLPSKCDLNIEKNFTVVSESDLGDGQVEIAKIPIMEEGTIKDTTVASFSTDFTEVLDITKSAGMEQVEIETTPEIEVSAVENISIETPPVYEEVSVLVVEEGKDEESPVVDKTELDTTELPVEEIVAVESAVVEKVESLAVDKPKVSIIEKVESELPNTVEMEMAKLTDTSIETLIVEQPQESTTSTKLLEILTDSRFPKKPSTPTINPLKISNPKFELESNEQPVSKSKSKLVIRSSLPASSKTGNKPIILSEKVIKPADQSKVSVQKVSSKQEEDLNDFESMDTYIIKKPGKRSGTPEDVNPEPVKLAKKTPPPVKSKPTILGHTIIKPGGEVIQPAIPAAKDENVFDIDSMPIVLTDQILTPESLEKMPIVIQQETPKPTIKKLPLPQMKLLNKTPPAFRPTTSKVITKQVKPQKVYHQASTIIKNPGLLAQGTKHGKFVIVPSETVTSTTNKYTVGKRHFIKKTTPTILAGTSKNTQSPPEPTGNKIMIVTNNQGQQSRVVLTPAQQKMIGYQTSAKKGTLKTMVQRDNTKSPNILSQTIINPKGQITTTNQAMYTSSTLTHVKKQRIEPSRNKLLGQKLLLQSSSNQAKHTPGQPRTILIKNPQGQTVKRIQGTDDALLEQQVAEQLEAINKAAATTWQQQNAAYKSQTKRYVKKTLSEGTKLALQTKSQVIASGSGKSGNIPPLAPITPAKKPEPQPSLKTMKPATAVMKSSPTPAMKPSPAAPTKTSPTVKTPVEKSPDKDETKRAPHQLVIQDALGNQTTITEGQILALPSETVDGQPQSYMLVTLDETGNLTPLNNEALMSLDPSLNLGGDLNNMVLQIDQGTLNTEAVQESPVAEETVEVEEPAVVATPNVPAPVVTAPPEPEVVVEKVVPEAEVQQPETDPNTMQAVACAINNGETNQQLIITGDPISTQKFLESLTEGNADLANLLANAEGNILIHADGQQILINTDSDNQMLLMNSDAGGAMESGEGSGNPIFSSQPAKNQDILAAALADTDVFQPDQAIVASSSKVSQSQLSPGNALYPMNVNNVLETSTMNSPIMTPLEVPSTNVKKIDDTDILTQIPKNLDLPITITDPNISQTVAHQSAMSAELHTNLELPLSIQDVAVTSAGMNSPFSYSLPTLDESVDMQKPFTSSISMPLLTEEPEDVVTTASVTVTATVPTEIIENNVSAPDAVPQPDLAAKTESEQYMLATTGMCTMNNQLCSSLSEPPPDMFDFTIDQSYDLKESADTNVDYVPEETCATDEKLEEEVETVPASEADSPGNSNDSCEIPVQPEIVTNLSSNAVPQSGSPKRAAEETAENDGKKIKFD